MSTEAVLMAVRHTDGAPPPSDSNILHHFDASCAKCRQIYGVWGPGSAMDEDNRQDRETWLKEYLPNVCPFHRDSFPVPGTEPS